MQTPVYSAQPLNAGDRIAYGLPSTRGAYMVTVCFPPLTRDGLPTPQIVVK
jgi:hypothetical protein